MTETARVLLTAGILSAVALTTFVWRLIRPGRAAHEYLIDQLRLSQLAAVLLAGTGAVGIGLAVAAASGQAALLEALVGLGAVTMSLLVLRSEPPAALIVVAALFLSHAIFASAHRPGLLSVQLVPRWWWMGCATYDVYLALLCLTARFLGKARWPK
ncbi:MAG: hypothetical protein ABIP90_01360 [Vicinamibacterales bacterium]